MIAHLTEWRSPPTTGETEFRIFDCLTFLGDKMFLDGILAASKNFVNQRIFPSFASLAQW